MIGKRLGNYRIESHLGSGAMARVFRAHHVHLDRPAAVKVLHDHLAEKEEFRERFLREARAVARLDNPGIVRVYEYDYEDGGCFIAMELLEGASLEDRLRGLPAGTCLPLEETLRIVRGVGDALAVAHSQGLAHRDVKPSNIMVTPDRVVLADFGIAISLDETRLTTDGSASGTPSYMSPEQVKGNRGDERSDIYSLGVLFYQLLCGELPFASETMYGMIDKHLHESPVPPSERVRGVPRAFDAVVMRALDKAPKDRYQNVEALLTDLEQAVQGVEVGAATRSAAGDPEVAAAETAAGSTAVPREVTSARRLGIGVVVLVLVAVVAGWVTYRAFFQGDVREGSLPAEGGSASEPLPSMAAEAAEGAGDRDELDAMTTVKGWTEGFEDNLRGWEESPGPPVARHFEAGAYWFEVRERNRAAATWATKGGVWADLRYVAEGTLVEGQPESGYGLIFFRADVRNYYVFAVNGLQQWSIWALVDGEWQSLADGGPWIFNAAVAAAGERNRLAVEASSSRLVLSVNDVVVHRLEVREVGPGGIGLYVATSRTATDAQALVRFDRASVQPLDAGSGKR